MRVTMVGHSTLILEGGTTRLLTDPWFGTFGNLAYARPRPPALTREEVPRVDGVLLSHGHWDHTDRRFLRSLDRSVPVLGPAGTGWAMRLRGVRRFQPMRAWDRLEVGEATITAVPALHLARTCGFVLELDGVCAYFAGDTYRRPWMAEIGRRFRLDVALMPVSTYRLPMTMGERGAVAAVGDLRPATVIPIHQGLRPRSWLLRNAQSVASFERRLRASGSTVEVVALQEGEHWEGGARPRTLDAALRQAAAATGRALCVS